MPAEITTSNPLGLGYQTGYFSGPVGSQLDQTFFNAAFAGRLNTNKIYKEAYHCNIIGMCGISEWLEAYMGYDTSCYPNYTLLETYTLNHFVEVQTTVVIDNYPNTTVIELMPANAFTSNAYLLPQVGNTLVMPNGELLDVTALGTASALDPKVTVRPRNPNFTDTSLLAGSKLLVLHGSIIADCACPTGQFRVPDNPIEVDLAMVEWGDKGEVCGDAVHKCQWLKIPFYDDCGKEYSAWYTEALQNMYRDHETRKFYEKLLNPSFGIIPQVKTRGLKWTPASASEITETDYRTWKSELDKMGNMCREFAIFAGRDLFSQFQKSLNGLAKSNLQYSERPLNDCAWINLNYCGIDVEGLKLHVYEECRFSNGKELGGPNSIFPSSAIIVPMCNRPLCKRSDGRQEAGASDEKMFSTVYFKSQANGKVWDNLTDSNGIFGPRNTFGAGCEKHEWTIKSRFTQEVHCANWWGYMNLTAA